MFFFLMLPILCQVTKTGTTICAVLWKDGVILGADTRSAPAFCDICVCSFLVFSYFPYVFLYLLNTFSPAPTSNLQEHWRRHRGQQELREASLHVRIVIQVFGK